MVRRNEREIRPFFDSLPVRLRVVASVDQPLAHAVCGRAVRGLCGERLSRDGAHIGLQGARELPLERCSVFRELGGRRDDRGRSLPDGRGGPRRGQHRHRRATEGHPAGPEGLVKRQRGHGWDEAGSKVAMEKVAANGKIVMLSLRFSSDGPECPRVSQPRPRPPRPKFQVVCFSFLLTNLKRGLVLQAVSMLFVGWFVSLLLSCFLSENGREEERFVVASEQKARPASLFLYSVSSSLALSLNPLASSFTQAQRSARSRRRTRPPRPSRRTPPPSRPRLP
jgi:hypothetical protein